MKSVRFTSFNKAFDSLPKDIQELATAQFLNWKKDPQSVMLKPLASTNNEIFSCPVNYRYRALALKTKDESHNPTYVWFWIGSHEDYNKLVARRTHLIDNIQSIRKKYNSNNNKVKTHTTSNA